MLQSDGNPGSLGGAGAQGVDDAHVGDGVLEWRGDGRVLEDGVAERFALQGVLVDVLEASLQGVLPFGAPDVHTSARGCVEGDVDLEAASGAEGVHALEGSELGGTTERGCGSVPEVEDGAGEAIGFEAKS